MLLKDSNIREDYDVMVVGIINSSGETNINPEPDTALKTTDTVLLMGEIDKMNRFKENLPSYIMRITFIMYNSSWRLKKKSLSNYEVNYTSFNIYRFNDFFGVQVFVQIFIILDNCFYHGFINI